MAHAVPTKEIARPNWITDIPDDIFEHRLPVDGLTSEFGDIESFQISIPVENDYVTTQHIAANEDAKRQPTPEGEQYPSLRYIDDEDIDHTRDLPVIVHNLTRHWEELKGYDLEESDEHKIKVALLQTHSNHDMGDMIRTIAQMAAAAKKMGADIVVTGEHAFRRGGVSQNYTDFPFPWEGQPALWAAQRIARELGITIVLGSLPDFPEGPDLEAGHKGNYRDRRFGNTMAVIGPNGKIYGHTADGERVHTGYRKTHPYDGKDKAGKQIAVPEVEATLKGEQYKTVTFEGGFTLGEAICNDARDNVDGGGYPDQWEGLAHQGNAHAVAFATGWRRELEEHEPWEPTMQRLADGNSFVFACDLAGFSEPETKYGRRYSPGWSGIYHPNGQTMIQDNTPQPNEHGEYEEDPVLNRIIMADIDPREAERERERRGADVTSPDHPIVNVCLDTPLSRSKIAA